MAHPRRHNRIRDLSTWLDIQEQKLFSPIRPPNDVVLAFDPLYGHHGADDFHRLEQPLGDQIAELYGIDADVHAQAGEEGRRNNRVRTRTWHFERGLDKPLVVRMLNKIRQAVRTRHKLILTFA